MDATRPDEEIVRELLLLADTDTTDPPNWALDLKLRELESETLQTGDEERFARICQMARAQSDDPHVRGLLILGILNGIRRPGSHRLHEVAGVVEMAKDSFAKLPPGLRKTRLVGFLNYQIAIFAGQTGQYRLASDTQLLAAIDEEGNDNLTGAAICRFMAAYEAVNQAIVEGAVDDLMSLPKDLVDCGKIMQLAFEEEDESSPEALRWLGFNAPIHRTMAHFWTARRSWSTMDIDQEGLDELFSSQFSLVKANQGAYYAALAIHALFEDDLVKAHALASMTLASFKNTSAEYLVTASMVLAAILTEINNGDPRNSIEVLKSAVNLDKPGGQQARAIAHAWLNMAEKGKTPYSP